MHRREEQGCSQRSECDQNHGGDPQPSPFDNTIA
jgi:hypothetical protein